MNLPSVVFVLALLSGFTTATASEDGFAIRDGDTVVFLGDSITAARSYGKTIENYTLMRYPDRKVHFHNAGWGGDTAAGGLARLERDVFSKGATLVTVAYGINDIGWGAKADEEHKRLYLESIRGIVEACQKRNVRVFVCSAAIAATDPQKTENDFLQTMCDEGLALAKSRGAGAIDVQRAMRSIQKRVWEFHKKDTEERRRSVLHVADGIHLTETGQLAMAFAMLKGLGAPADISSAAIDANGTNLVEARGCKVTDLKSSEGGIEFDRLDEGLPINFGALGALNFMHIPIPEELNRYRLTVKNLPAGKHSLVVDGRKVGVWPHTQWAAGINISSATADPWQPGGPWDAQATVVLRLTEARNDLELGRMMANLYGTQLDARPQWKADSADLNSRIEALQHLAARPAPYHFGIQPEAGERKDGK